MKGQQMISDKQLVNFDVAEGRTDDRSDVQLGRLTDQKDAFNDARREAMKAPGYHPAFFNRRQRGITG